VLRKWDAIDDEIWAKAIVMERNKRVAKVTNNNNNNKLKDKVSFIFLFILMYSRHMQELQF